MRKSRLVRDAGTLSLLAMFAFIAGAAATNARLIKGEGAKLYQAPSTDATVLSDLKKGEEVTLVEVKDQWAKVKTKGGAEGWVERKLLAVKPPPGPAVKHAKKSAAGVRLHVVEVDLRGGQVSLIPVSASGMDYASKTYGDESFGGMIQRVGAVAAINGCYFDKKTKKPIGDVAIRGQRLHNGGGWAYFGITSDLKFSWGYDNPIQSRVDWTGHHIGITCLPMLVRNGKVLINTKEDVTNAGFRDSHIFMKMPRSAIVETKDGKILLVASGNTYLPNFAKALKEIGAVNALGLDGGASTALYANGRTVHPPGRKLTTILAVVKKPYGALSEAQAAQTPSVSTPAATPPASPAPAGEESDVCQYLQGQTLDCQSCQYVIQTLEQQGESDLAACYRELCGACR